jgi:hypothetical protein
VIWDPCCGWGRIPQAAVAAGYRAIGSDIVDRGAASKTGITFRRIDFLCNPPVVRLPFSIIGNPPFDRLQEFVARALALGARKVAFIWRIQRLAAARWLQGTPLARIYLLTPRPSMPPGSHIEAGGYVGGDSHDYAWLVFERGHNGRPELHWLLRDGKEP